MPESTSNPTAPVARGRGFAGLDPERRRDIAREGGRAAHAKGTAHEFTSAEARDAAIKSRLGRRPANGNGAAPAASSASEEAGER